jgi:Protein of unknown function (DUF4232)
MRATVIFVVVLACSAASTATARPSIARCTGTQLSGRFAVVRDSAGAGNISYRLTLTNVSRRTCTLTGLPQGRLLGRYGGALPTHVRAAFPGALTAVLVRLKPGASSHATARFSPDVPGPGEGQVGACEPTAHTFRVAAQGGGTTIAKLRPPTPVCEHGTLSFSAYAS